jgi:thiamine-monophosphate kinase
MPRNRKSEDAILQKIAQRTQTSQAQALRHAVSLGMGDDAALFRPKQGFETLLTCDWFLEGTHFLREQHPPDAVGWKCLARAVSDIAAMGGTARCFLLSLALPGTHTGRWLSLFLGGLQRASRKFHCVLAGGDTTRRKEILLHVTVIGEARRGFAVRRSGARRGDLIYVSGTLNKHLYPMPHLGLGSWLAERKMATAMMDLSDGLSTDLARLCAASRVGALLHTVQIPQVQIPRAAQKQAGHALPLALHGGDDYELLFTVPPRKAQLLPKIFQGVPLTAIGRITRSQKVLLLDEQGHANELLASGWDPFGKKR